MTTLSKEDVVQLIEELGAGSNWLSGKHDVYSYNRQPKIAAMFLKAFAEQGLLELIAELRKPHNWKIEGFGHFKDVKMHQSDAPFRAATALEHFATLARADLVAENERLKKQLRQQAEAIASTINKHHAALAAEEADNERLRNVLNGCLDMFDPEVGSSHLHRKLTVIDIRKSIAQPCDDSALREMIAGVYEECAKYFDGRAHWEMFGDRVADDIRELAEKAKV